MSAPQTDLERQKRRHAGPLVGMALAVLVGVGVIVYWIFDEAEGDQSPAEDPAASTLPLSPEPPDVIEPGPQPDPSLPQGDTAPVPAPQEE